MYGLMAHTDHGAMPRIDPFSPHFIADAILAMNMDSTVRPIWVMISSIGGVVDDGLVLYDAIKTSRAPVYTVGRNCMSMGAIILSAGNPGHRYIYPRSRVMLHQPSSISGGDAATQTKQVAEIQRLHNLLVDLLIENGVSKPRNEILMDIDREFWMNANETINYGVADQLVTSDILFPIVHS